MQPTSRPRVFTGKDCIELFLKHLKEEEKRIVRILATHHSELSWNDDDEDRLLNAQECDVCHMPDYVHHLALSVYFAMHHALFAALCSRLQSLQNPRQPPPPPPPPPPVVQVRALATRIPCNHGLVGLLVLRGSSAGRRHGPSSLVFIMLSIAGGLRGVVHVLRRRHVRRRSHC